MTGGRTYSRYRATKISWADSLPEHWEEVPVRWHLKNLDGIRMPLNSAQRSEIPGDVPYWGSGGIVGHIGKHLFENSVLLVGEDGAPFFDATRPVAYVVHGRSWINNHIHVMQGGRALPLEWYCHAFNCVDYSQFIDGTTRDKLTQEGLKSIFLPAPPASEVSQILAALDGETARIDALIEEKTRFIELLKEKRQALITQVVTKGLDSGSPMRDSGVEWLGEVPAHWEVIDSKRLFSQRKELAREDDIQLSATQAYGVIPQDEYERRSGYRVVKIHSNLEKRKHVEVDDFVISMRSFQGGLERAWSRGCIRSSYIVLRPLGCVDINYYSYLFKANRYIAALQSTSNFIRDGQDLNFDNFTQVPLVVVPIDEQKAIARFLDKELDAISRIVKITQRSIDLLKERRIALITAAVTGQIDLRETE